MKNISFGSTFRIPISQPGVNTAKKEHLKELVESYENGLIGNSKTGYARVSIPDSDDADFVRRLKLVGYKIFQKFDGENLPKNQIDAFIKEKLNNSEYSQLGKHKQSLTVEQRLKKCYESSFNILSEKITTENNNAHKSVVEENFRNSKPKLPSNNVKTISATADKLLSIRNSEGYLRIKNEYGEAFAEAVFFNKR